jgi:putative nucleotidyltransferase with HDIG domain
VIHRSTLVRIAMFLATVFAAWAVLSLGAGAESLKLEVGEPAPDDFWADRTDTVIDIEETRRLQQQARDDVPPPREVDAEVEAAAINDIQAVFEDLASLAIDDGPVDSEAAIPELPAEETTTTSPEDEETTIPEETDPAVLSGVVFIDADGDGIFNTDNGEGRMDRGIPGVGIEVRTHTETLTANTNDEGVWTVEYAGGDAVVVVNANDPEIPNGYAVSTENTGQLVECPPEEACEVDSVGLGVQLTPVEDVVQAMTRDHGALPSSTVEYLAEVAGDDVIRAAFNEPLHLPTIREEALDEARLTFVTQIEPEDLQLTKGNIRRNPPQVYHPDTGFDELGSQAAGEAVATYLQANYLIDEDRWEEEQRLAALAVPEQEVEYTEGTLIVSEGVPLTALHISAIDATSNPTLEEQPSIGVVAVVVVLVGLLGLYLATFRPEFWARPRMVALLGIMIVLAAASVRGTVALEETFSWYVLPAVAFGFVTAVLFDQRIAVLMALAVGVLTAVGTLDPGVTVYGMLAAMAPIPFVSAVSTRGAFRNAVVLSSLVAATVALSTAWFFHIGPDTFGEVVPLSVAWAFGVSILASLLGLAALQFFESAFDITTTLGLLDLTDRNHEALQMLQEKAFGTFNHSLMVGTLADAAARAVGANSLLARAMAYYHDLGKTENPTFFIENQFGMTNPHDDLDPRESAQIVRDHVAAGVALARDYKIPTDVTEGIVSHHGDGVMRFFFEKARQLHGDDVNIGDFRHIGHKPRTAESAILMLADSLEAACRAVFQTEEPTPDSIEKVVDRIMNEKMEDGQLSESPLTLAEISKIRKAFLDSLIGHYHQRIAYPNFPGS